MLRATGRVAVSAFIVLFFVGMMSLLVYREVLRPRWSPQYRALPITEPKDYCMAVLSGEERVGYITARVAPKMKEGRHGTHFQLTANLALPLFGKTADMMIHGEGFRENVTDRAEFDFSMRSAEQEFRIEGTLDGGKLDSKVHVADSVTPFKYDLGNQMLFSAGASGLDLPPLKPGEEIYMDAFNPVSMRIDKARISCEKTETITVMGHEILANVLETELGAMKTRAWVNEAQEVVRVVTPFGFTLEKIDPKDISIHKVPGEQADMVKNLAVHVEGKIPERGVTHLKLRFSGVAPESMPPSDALQTREGDIYDIRSATPPTEGESAPLPDAELKAALSSDPLVNAENPDIQKAAHDIVGDASAPWDKANRIYTWVYDNLEKTSVLSVPAALDVLRTKQGDCNEHTVLFTALARAVGIPTRMAIGLVYSEEVGGFGYHAWPEVYIGKWIPMDPTLGQPIADATHIKLLNGGIEEWGRLIAYIGQAKIEVLGVE